MSYHTKISWLGLFLATIYEIIAVFLLVAASKGGFAAFFEVPVLIPLGILFLYLPIGDGAFLIISAIVAILHGIIVYALVFGIARILRRPRSLRIGDSAESKRTVEEK